MRRMTIVVEVTDGPAAGAATAGCHAGCHTACHEGPDRRRGNERRGSGPTAAPSPAGARPYGFRSFRDRRSDAGERVAPAAELGVVHPLHPVPTGEQIRLRVAAAYGDADDSAAGIIHRIDLCL